MNKLIVHVSEVDLVPTGGMGRVEHNWRLAFEKRGFTFLHIGPAVVGSVIHKGLFPYKAYAYYKKLKVNPRAFLIHEPISGRFVNKGIPCFVESHGLERRAWENSLMTDSAYLTRLSLKTKLLFPIWRLAGCDKGLRNAHKLMLINSEDKNYAINKYMRKSNDIFLFNNGINRILPSQLIANNTDFKIVFNGSWLERKGIYVLIKAAELLLAQKLPIHYLLIGTAKNEDLVLNDWPENLRKYVSIVSFFPEGDEPFYLNSASLFVLPSFYEGQPLSLLQAMAAGKCCITTNCCGQKDMIVSEKTGFLFEKGDYYSLANLIKYCFENPNVIKQVGHEAKNSVDDLTWDNVADQVVEYVIENS